MHLNQGWPDSVVLPYTWHHEQWPVSLVTVANHLDKPAFWLRKSVCLCSRLPSTLTAAKGCGHLQPARQVLCKHTYAPSRLYPGYRSPPSASLSPCIGTSE